MSKYYAIILLVLGLLTRFLFWNHPQETVFDEVHYLHYASAYYTGEYVYNLHPPLAGLLLAGFGKFTGFKPEFSLAQVSYLEIGRNFPNKDYLPLRFLPMLAGALLPLVIFLLAKEIGLSQKASFAAGLLVVFDNALVVQSRFILAEPFLLFFGFLCLYFYFRYRRARSWTDLILAGVLGSFAFSVKWTGGSFIALVMLTETFWLIKEKRYRDWKEILKIPIVLVLLPLFIYFSIFVIQFSLLSKKGSGDAYVGPFFRNQNLLQKFVEINRIMLLSNYQDLTHPYGSKWYAWPFGLRPIYYWMEGKTQIYLAGNPVIWWSSTAAALTLLLYIGLRQALKDKISAIFLAGYFINFLPFIAIKRIMFLYHYLPALIFGILILAHLIDVQKNAKMALAVLSILVVAGFIYSAPVTYGLPR